MASFRSQAESPLQRCLCSRLERGVLAKDRKQAVHPYLFNLDRKTPFRCQPLEDDVVSSGPDPQVGQRAGAALKAVLD
jgi:hypothetical protein